MGKLAYYPELCAKWDVANCSLAWYNNVKALPPDMLHGGVHGFDGDRGGSISEPKPRASLKAGQNNNWRK